MKIEAHAVVLGDNVNTDLLHPPAYFAVNAKAAAKGAFAGLPGGIDALGPPPWILVAGKNFGCGSSRESTLMALKVAGVLAVAARSTSHIFRRNAVNLGIPVVLLEESLQPLSTGDPVTLDLNANRISGPNSAVNVVPPEPYEQAILNAGGLRAFVAQGIWPFQELS